MRKRILLIAVALLSFVNHSFACGDVIIDIQPVGNFTEKEADALAGDFAEYLYKQLGLQAEIYVLPVKPLQSKYLNNNKTRYDACKLSNAFKQKEVYTIVLLHKDISLPKYRGRTDWGVVGLTLQPGKTCVVSDFRLRNKKRDFCYVVVHEFIHAFYNYKHCPANDDTCLMKDAKGRVNFANKKSLCKVCRQKIKKHVHH